MTQSPKRDRTFPLQPAATKQMTEEPGIYDIGDSFEFVFQKEDSSVVNAVASLSSINILPEPPKDADLELFNHLQGGYFYQLMWFLKDRLKLWKRTDYPFNTLVCQAYESGGAVMVAELNLCEAVLDYSVIKLPYSPLGFWYRVQSEQKIAIIGNAFFSKETKEAMVKHERKMIAKLAAWENPYSPDNERMHHSFNLISAAIIIGKPQPCDDKQVAKKRKNFRVKAWQPFLSALRWHARDLDKGVKAEDSGKTASFKAYQIRNDSLIALMDGRHSEIIYSPPKKNISNRGKKRI